MKPAISIRNLRVVMDREPILMSVTLDLAAGKVIGLLGPSGAGKTTLMRVIAGLKRPTEGEVVIFDQPAGSSKLRPLMGYATQSLAVYPDLTVRENLGYFAAMTNSPKGRVQEVLAEVSLEEQASKLVRALSGGQRARVSLAVALLGKPKLLVLDEPTVGLDPLLRNQLWEYFHRLAAAGTTLLVSSHVMDEAERCDDLVLMRAGRVIAHAAPATVRREAGARTVEQAFIKLVGEAA